MGFFDELKKLTRPYDDEDEFFSEGEVPVSQQEGDGLQDRRQSFFAEAEGASDAYEPAPAQQHAVHNPPRRERAGKTDSRVVNIGSGKQQVVDFSTDAPPESDIFFASGKTVFPW